MLLVRARGIQVIPSGEYAGTSPGASGPRRSTRAVLNRAIAAPCADRTSSLAIELPAANPCVFFGSVAVVSVTAAAVPNAFAGQSTITAPSGLLAVPAAGVGVGVGAGAGA